MNDQNLLEQLRLDPAQRDGGSAVKRRYWVAGGVLLLSTFSLSALALFPTPAGLIAASVVYGLTIGNVTTLPPIIVRREFGAASFGALYGVSASAIQVANAFGPGMFGVMRDAFGSYAPPLLVAAVLNFIAAAVIIWGGRKALPISSSPPIQ